MKRHPGLHALSHDHHHALVAARRLRRAAEAGSDLENAAAEFLDFFRAVTVAHFREEEEELFPLVVDESQAQPLVVQALLDHQRLHCLAASLELEDNARESMLALSGLLEEHVRREERELFPLIERLAAAELAGRSSDDRGGPVWGRESEDLNATLLRWPPGQGPGEQVNRERDVLLYAVEGSATLEIDGDEHELRAGDAAIVPKGARRRLIAGAHGVQYLSVHLRRPPLQITRLADDNSPTTARNAATSG